MEYERVAITGGCGRLGRYVSSELRSRCQVTLVDHTRSENSHLSVHADILDPQKIREALSGHDAIIHLAAIDASVPASDKAVFETNVQGTWNVLQAAWESRVRRVILCSSNGSVGLDQTNLVNAPEYLPVDEKHPRRPTRAYGLSKKVCEIIGSSFARRNSLEVICLRPTYIVYPELLNQVAMEVKKCDGGQRGDGDYPEEGNASALTEPLPFLRSYVEPEDVAQAFRLALEIRDCRYDVFFISARETFSPIPTLEYVQRVYGVEPTVRNAALYRKTPRASPFDISHARDRLGWEPKGSWGELLQKSGIADGEFSCN